MKATHMTLHRLAGTPALGTWFRRAGMAGFMFFLVKGLFWLALPAILSALLPLID